MTMGVCIMTWKEAKQGIKNNVVVGTDVNTVKKNGDPRSTYRIVKFVLDDGYIIPMGRGYYMFVTWEMLEKCWRAMNNNDGVYGFKELREDYPGYPRCYVQTIRRIFEKAGLT